MPPVPYAAATGHEPSDSDDVEAPGVRPLPIPTIENGMPKSAATKVAAIGQEPEKEPAPKKVEATLPIPQPLATPSQTLPIETPPSVPAVAAAPNVCSVVAEGDLGHRADHQRPVPDGIVPHRNVPDRQLPAIPCEPCAACTTIPPCPTCPTGTCPPGTTPVAAASVDVRFPVAPKYPELTEASKLPIPPAPVATAPVPPPTMLAKANEPKNESWMPTLSPPDLSQQYNAFTPPRPKQPAGQQPNGGMPMTPQGYPMPPMGPMMMPGGMPMMAGMTPWHVLPECPPA